MVHEITKEEVNYHVLGVIMSHQFSLNVGLKKFGDEGKVAATKVLKQLHNRVTYVPMDASKMIKGQRKEAMRSQIFLTKKWDGRIKSQACADGYVEIRCPGYKKEDTALPTISTEAVFITGAIEVHEGRIVACFDILGAYLHTDCSKKGEKFILLEGQLSELVVLVEPRL